MDPIAPNLRCNEQIRITPIRLIDELNNQIGVVENYEAQKRAREAGLDLVEVAPNERPPVCRIMDYGKWKYKQKKSVRKHHEQQLKEVRIRPKTDLNDRNIKVKNALQFLRKGDKVQFKMVFRGRERAHREIGYETFRGIVTELGDLVKVERPPAMDGRDMIMVLSPNKTVLDKQPSTAVEKAGEKAAREAEKLAAKAAARAGQDAPPTDVATASADEADVAQPEDSQAVASAPSESSTNQA